MLNTFICAEIGSNHDGCFDKAIKMIREAKNAGCDGVKFQLFKSKTLYSKKTPNFAIYKNIPELIKSLELPHNWLPDLKKYCDLIGIEFISTPFDEEAINTLVNLGVSKLKIAAFESSDPRFVKLCAKTGLPIIFSAGVNVNPYDTIHWICEEKSEYDITVLHCNSAYPTPYEDCNINTVSSYFSSMPSFVKVGISDHTEGTLVPSLAVIQGASFVEVHFTLDKNSDGPDHKFARNPLELKKLVDNARVAEKCKGTKNRITNSERKFQNATRSIVTIKDIKKGEKLSIKNITTMRPFFYGNIPAERFFDVFGKKTNKDIKENTPINIGDIVD